MTSTSIGARIKAKRAELDLTQAQLARDVGISPAYMCDIERNKRMPKGAVLERLTGALGIDPTSPNGHPAPAPTPAAPPESPHGAGVLCIPRALADYAERQQLPFHHVLALLRIVDAARGAGDDTLFDDIDWERLHKQIGALMT